MRYRFGGLTFGGAYTWRGLFSEFYGKLLTIRVSLSFILGTFRSQNLNSVSYLAYFDYLEFTHFRSHQSQEKVVQHVRHSPYEAPDKKWSESQTRNDQSYQ